MNISKRTWIIIAVALAAFIAALASLYFEKESEINELVKVDPEPAPRVKKEKKVDSGPIKSEYDEPVIEPKTEQENDLLNLET